MRGRQKTTPPAALNLAGVGGPGRSIKKELLAYGDEELAAAAASAAARDNLNPNHNPAAGGARPQPFFVLEQVSLSAPTLPRTSHSLTPFRSQPTRRSRLSAPLAHARRWWTGP
jgi:hypothetical protein